MTTDDVRVFISYRRRDCQVHANGLHDGLVHRLPGGSIFKDIDSIPFGADFEEHIRDEIRRCDVVLVLIGDEWLDVRDPGGARRLDAPGDIVRLEIETALSTPSVRVIPVLVEGAAMPGQVDLPPSIRRLARLRAVELSDSQWRRDLSVLTEAIQQMAGAGAAPHTTSDPDAERQRRASTIGLGALDEAAIATAVGELPARFQTKDLSESPLVMTAHPTARRARNYHTMVGRYLLKHQRTLRIRSAGKSENGRGEWWERLGASGTEEAAPGPRQSTDEADSAKAVLHGASSCRYRPPVAAAMLDALVASTGLDRSWVHSAVSDLHFVVDCLVADDCTVVLPPVVLRRAGDPLAAALLSRFLDHPSPDLLSPSDEELTAVLDVPHSMTDEFPVAWVDEVIVDMAALHGIDVLDEGVRVTELEAWWTPYEQVVDAWLAAWEGTAPVLVQHQVSVLDRDADVRAWVGEHLGDLADAGLPVRLHAYGHRFGDGYTADLVCRATEDGGDLTRGDWLIVKTQPDMADLGALEQLKGQMEACQRELATPGEAVKGLLVSDGVTVELQAALRQAGCLRLSLAGLGIRGEWSDRLRVASSPSEADRVRAASLRVDVLPAAVMNALYAAPPAAAKQQWVVGGVTYGKRAEANRALAAALGSYTRQEWAEAQRQHGLR